MDMSLLPSGAERKTILEQMIANLKHTGYVQQMEALQKRAQLPLCTGQIRKALEEQIAAHDQASARAYAGAKALLEELAQVEAQLAEGGDTNRDGRPSN